MMRQVAVWTGALSAVVIIAAVGLTQFLFTIEGGDSIDRWQLFRFAVITAGLLALLVHGPFVWLIFTHRRLLRQLRVAALTDPLTGLPNRRAFFQHVTQSLGWPGPSCGTFSVLMIDVDRFKDINDRLGHEAGDAALVRIAREIESALARAGAGDAMFARIGGEEFAAFLPQADLEVSSRVADTLCSGVRAASFEHQGQPVSFSISVGVWSGAGLGIDAALARADAAVYAAKAGGRDRWVVADETPRGRADPARFVPAEVA